MSASSSRVNGAIGQVLQHGVSGSTLLLVLLTALFGRDALDTQLRATDRTVEAVEELRTEMVAMRTDVMTLGGRVLAIETLADELAAAERRNAAFDARLEDLEARVAALSQCIAEGKRCRG